MITCYEQTAQAFWIEVPCRGEDSSIVAWVEGRNIVFGRVYGPTEDPPTAASMTVRLDTFERVLRRVLSGRDMRLPGHGGFYWEAGRIIYQTECNEDRRFDPADLDALLTWATAPDEEE